VVSNKIRPKIGLMCENGFNNIAAMKHVVGISQQQQNCKEDGNAKIRAQSKQVSGSKCKFQRDVFHD